MNQLILEESVIIAKGVCVCLYGSIFEFACLMTQLSIWLLAPCMSYCGHTDTDASDLYQFI